MWTEKRVWLEGQNWIIKCHILIWFFFFNFFSFSFLCHVSVMFFAKILYIFLCSPKLLVNFLLNELFAFNFGMQWLSIIFQFLLHRKISLLLLNIKKILCLAFIFLLVKFSLTLHSNVYKSAPDVWLFLYTAIL